MLRNNIFLNINRDIVNCHHYNIYFENPGFNSIKAYEANTSNIVTHILSTIGEYFERESLINRNPAKEKYTKAVSLINGNEIVVNSSDLVFDDKFVDSCGMASQKNAKMAIWTAYKEFFERQCYIASILLQLDGVEIILPDDCIDFGINRYLYNFLDQIKYYDISLSNDLHVILALGYNNIYNAAGLGTSTSLKKALIKSQYEILQYFAVGHSKHHYSEAMTIDSRGDKYLQQFNSLTRNEFFNYYRYLNHSSKINLTSEYNSEKEIDVFELIRMISGNCKMNPHVAVLKSRENTNIKVVKVFDPKWFPNMNPQTYSYEQIGYVEKIFNKTIRNLQFLPFA